MSLSCKVSLLTITDLLTNAVESSLKCRQNLLMDEVLYVPWLQWKKRLPVLTRAPAYATTVSRISSS